MKFGVILPAEGGVTGGVPDARTLLTFARRAEKLGFGSLWVGDRLLLSPRLEPFSALGASAALTRNVSLGMAVLLAPLRHPVLLAQMLASLDVLSKGRLIVGLGVGPQRIRPEYDALEIPFRQRGQELDECVEIMKRLWSENSVSFSGKHHRLRDVVLKLKPWQSHGPPIWFGGYSKAAIRRVARLGDGWFPIEIQPQQYAAGLQKISQLAMNEGRDPSRISHGFYLTINIRENRDESHEEAQEFLDAYYGSHIEAVEKFGFFGNREDCIKGIQAYAAAGVETMVVRFASFRPLKMLTVLADVVSSF